MVNVKLEIPEKTIEAIEKLTNALIQALQSPFSVQPTRLSPAPYGPIEPIVVTDEEKALVEAWLKEVDPVIEKEAISTLKMEIREMMRMGGNVKAISKAIKEGKKPKIVRKKEGRRDPLFIHIGDGVEEPIEEIYIFG